MKLTRTDFSKSIYAAMEKFVDDVEFQMDCETPIHIYVNPKTLNVSASKEAKTMKRHVQYVSKMDQVEDVPKIADKYFKTETERRIYIYKVVQRTNLRSGKKMEYIKGHFSTIELARDAFDKAANIRCARDIIEIELDEN